MGMKSTLVIFTLVLIGAGIFIFTNQSADPASDSAQNIEQEQSYTATPEVSPTRVDPEWVAYRNEDYGFIIQYPADWTVNNDIQMFRTGDVFSIETIGPNQPEGTEFFDGARVSVMNPVESDMAADEWVRNEYSNDPVSDPPEFSQETIGTITFDHVYTCGLGCFDYYHHKHNGMIYGFVTFAGGSNEEQHRETIRTILTSFSYTDSPVSE